MDEIRVPQHVVDRFERRWTARWRRCWKAGNVWTAPADATIRSDRRRSGMEGFLRPPTIERRLVDQAGA
jgi:hypothetical protein